MPDVLTARLKYIALESPDPGALARWHSDVMGLTLSSTSRGILGTSGDRHLFFVPGEARALGGIGYAVAEHDELDRLCARLASVSWPFVETEGDQLFRPGALAIADPDGNRIVFGVEHEASRNPVGSALPARLQHVVVASRNAARLASFFEEVLGFQRSDNVRDDGGVLRTAFLRCNEEHHSFAVFQASSDRLDHHCYEAGDWNAIRDWGDHFAHHDVKIEWGPGRHGPGNNLFLFVHDHDGNWLEISAELEIVVRDRPIGEWPHAQKTLNSWGTAPLRS